MIALLLILGLTSILSACVRLAGGSRFLAIVLGLVPMVVFQAVTFGPKIRTPSGEIVPGWQVFLGSLLIPAAVAGIVSLSIARKERPIQLSEPTAPSGRGPS